MLPGVEAPFEGGTAKRSALFSSMTPSARLAVITWIIACAPAAAQEPSIVPNPASVVREAGEFPLSAATPVMVARGDPALRMVAANFSDLVWRFNALKLGVR